MPEILPLATVALAAAAVVLLILLLRKKPESALLEARLAMLQENGERIERGLREEIARNRDEVARSISSVGEITAREQRALRQDVAEAIKGFGDSVTPEIAEMHAAERLLREEVTASLSQQISEMNLGHRGLREEIRGQMDGVTTRLSDLAGAVENRLKTLQEDNAAKLDQMRQTVDEKLQSTLEKRLGESFQLVSDRLEQVYRGLGEMQALATGVGDLKKVLTNVKTRGTWGEVQLGNLLEQVLAPDQYAQNVAVTGERERVEFAIRLPGRDEAESTVWLPIDAKFPQEDYQRLVDAAERADSEGVDSAVRQLEARLKSCARDIAQKYLHPPQTTDFGILYLPTEGLYAEVLRRPGLADVLQREYRVVVAGPTTLTALLNSLQMGFRTLAIQKRSSEVWTVLGAVKTEFQKYGDVLERVRRKLEEASKTVDSAAVRTRAIRRTLREVEALPDASVPPLVGEAGNDSEFAAAAESVE